MPPARIFRLQGSVQNYDWGKQGDTSLVAHLAKNAVGEAFQYDRNEYYAEVWMGTHPNGPARSYEHPNQELLKTIASDPTHYLGQTLITKWPSTVHVPYLFKVLSIAKALPLQVHPDKSIADRLSKEKPDEFVDSNHKPEIAIAIGEPLTSNGGWGDGVAFTGFLGFKPLADIKKAIENIPELRAAIGSDAAVNSFINTPSKENLKAIFGALSNRGAKEPEVIKKHVRQLVDRIKSSNGPNLGEEMTKLIIKADGQYPGDVGVLSTSFFMNFVKLKKGESIYIGADEIHAYLEGDIIECMAFSDNVLNAGFTDPMQAKEHVSTFLESLTYTARDVSHWDLHPTNYPHSQLGRTKLYAPPFEEFVVLGTSLKDDEHRDVLGEVNGPTIGIVTKGTVKLAVGDEAVVAEEGTVVYVVPHSNIEIELSGRTGENGIGEVWWATSMI